ncbi:hypothetical protein GCM10009555_059920 [Acrocarpospora macrocephala]|uniref:Uncharacterized protein n=1 Tax=Acrocarpospora macrocephala TaxID=150177 RepID=A0A5M3WPT3_9ACTN|nr:hypothetical protein Amac_037390 [Acrocarpospora macrocephala]
MHAWVHVNHARASTGPTLTTLRDMASIEVRVRRSGAPSYRIWWRLGGGRGGRPQSRTFRAYGEAIAFKYAVETAGHQWPPAIPAASQPDRRHLFGDYALAFVAGRSGIEERTRHDYERGLRNHILPTLRATRHPQPGPQPCPGERLGQRPAHRSRPAR